MWRYGKLTTRQPDNPVEYYREQRWKSADNKSIYQVSICKISIYSISIYHSRSLKLSFQYLFWEDFRYFCNISHLHYFYHLHYFPPPPARLSGDPVMQNRVSSVSALSKNPEVIRKVHLGEQFTYVRQLLEKSALITRRCWRDCPESRSHKAWYPTKVYWFSVIFKDNLETLSLAEACLSFPECSEQFFGSLET